MSAYAYPKNLNNVGEAYDLSLQSFHTDSGADGKTVATKGSCCGLSKKCMIIIGTAVTVSLLLVAAITAVSVTQVEEANMQAAQSKLEAEVGEINRNKASPYLSSLVVTLDYNGYSNCAATMITNQHAITSARCFSNWTKLDRVPRMKRGFIGAKISGSRSVHKYDLIDIESYVINPQYRPNEKFHDTRFGAAESDIALITFKEPVDQKRWPKFSPLPMCANGYRSKIEKRYEGYIGVLPTIIEAGVDLDGTTVTTVIEKNQPFISDKTCLDRYYSSVKVEGRRCFAGFCLDDFIPAVKTQSMACFGSDTKEDQEVCKKRTNGAPIIVDGCLAGVMAWGRCFKTGAGVSEPAPGLYSNIAFKTSWIIDEIEKTGYNGTYGLQERDGVVKYYDVNPTRSLLQGRAKSCDLSSNYRVGRLLMYKDRRPYKVIKKPCDQVTKAECKLRAMDQWCPDACHSNCTKL